MVFKILLLLFITTTSYCQNYQYNSLHVEVDGKVEKEEFTDIIFNIDLDNYIISVHKIIGEKDTINSIFPIIDSEISKKYGLFMTVDFLFYIDYKKDVMMVRDINKKLFFYNAKM